MSALVKNRFVFPFLILIISTLSIELKAVAASPKAIFDVLSYQEVVEIDLSVDLNALSENRNDDIVYPAKMSFLDEQGNQQNWSLNISLRGKFRRKHCVEMPPLKLDFSKKDLQKAGLAQFDDLKLVNYCMGDDKRAKETLIKEYLAYKLYNQITEVSFRVQMVRIKFKDINSRETRTQLGFLIEDTAQLRARIGAEKIDSFRITAKDRFHPYYLRTTALFQYMIGNKDWGLTFSKNVKYLSKENQVILVPYDFDFSALVNASYTAPNKNARNPFTHGRVYRGFKEKPEVLLPVIEEFVAKKDHLLSTIQNCSLLKASSKKEMIAYLEFFFENTENIKFANTPI